MSKEIKQPVKVLIRQEGEERYIDFYAVVFDQPSKPIFEDGKEFLEIVETGAADNADISNVLATLFHDRDKIIGRTKAGTLGLRITEIGLLASVRVGDTTLHRDTVEMINRGDLYECSFIAGVSEWTDGYEDNVLIRRIKKIDYFRDVSIVADGAYSNTNIIIREFMKDEKAKEKEIKRAEEAATAEAEKTAEREAEEAEEEETEREEDDGQEAPKEAERAARPKSTAAKVVTRTGSAPVSRPRFNPYEAVRNSATGAGGSVVIERAAVDGDTSVHGNVIPKGVAPLSIIGKKPLWQEMGVDFNPNAKGTYVLPYQSPIIGQKLAELASVTKDVTTPSGTLIMPRRFSVQKVLTLESIASASDDYLSKLISDMQYAADRKITSEVYLKALAGATLVAGGAITQAGFKLLMGGAEVEDNGAFMASRNTFFEAFGTPIDAGSGLFLAQMGATEGIGTALGAKFFNSQLFEDGAAQKYVVYGDTSMIHVADFGMTEVIIDKVTMASTGQIVFTVNKLADVALMNPVAFAKTPDLDAAV